MKRIFTMLLALLLLAAVACTAPETDPTPTQAAELPTEQPTEEPTLAPTEQPTEEPTPEPTEGPTKMKTVQVSTVDEFLAAIAPNTEIVMASGLYNLGTAKDYGKPEETQSRYYTWQRCTNYDVSEVWYELILKRVENLHIIGEEGTIIRNQPRCRQTLTFEKCRGLVLSDLTVQDSGDDYVIGGGILCLSKCSDTRIERCDVGGRYGYIGLIAVSCDGLIVTDSDIHNSGGVQLFKCKDILIDNSAVRDCRTMYLSVNDDWSIGGYNFNTYSFQAIFTAESCTNMIVSDCDIYGNKADLCIRFQNPVDFSGTSVRDNLVSFSVIQAYSLIVDGCEFKRNTYSSSNEPLAGEEAVLINDDAGACDADGNRLDEAALKAMALKRDKVSEQQPEPTQEPTEITELPCSTPYWYEVFLDENGEHTKTEVVLFICDFDGDGTVETLSCRDVGQAYTFLLDGEAFLTLESVTYVTVIDLDPSTPYLNLIFAKKRTSEAYAKSFEMHLVNGEFVKGATVAACLRWDGEALRGGSIRTDLLGTKDGSRIYAGENFEPQSEWFDCENIPTEEKLENNRDELIRRGILLLVKKDLQGTVSGGQPTVIPKGTYVYMTRWHESNTIVKVITEEGKAVYLATAIHDLRTWWDDYMRDFLEKNPDYDPSEFYCNGGYLINGLPQDVYFDNLFYSD